MSMGRARIGDKKSVGDRRELLFSNELERKKSSTCGMIRLKILQIEALKETREFRRRCREKSSSRLLIRTVCLDVLLRSISNLQESQPLTMKSILSIPRFRSIQVNGISVSRSRTELHSTHPVHPYHIPPYHSSHSLWVPRV